MCSQRPSLRTLRRGRGRPSPRAPSVDFTPRDSEAEWRSSWAELERAFDRQRAAQQRLLSQAGHLSASIEKQLEVASLLSASPSAAGPDRPQRPNSGRLDELHSMDSADCVAKVSAPWGGDTVLSPLPSVMTSATQAPRRDYTAQELALVAFRDDALRRRDLSGVFQATFARVALWWSSVEEPARTGFLARVLSMSAWEFSIALVIMINSLFVGFSTDQAFTQAYTGESVVDVNSLEVLFVVFFAVELILRLVVHRQYFFCNEEMAWNLFDFVVVLISISDVVVSLRVGLRTGGNASFMRSVRLLRLVRTLRVLRVFRFASSLRRMAQSLVGSLVELFWSLVLMGFVFYIFAIATVQGVTDFVSNEGHRSPDLADELHLYFGSVLQTMVTYYMATSGGESWTRYYEALSRSAWLVSVLFVFAVMFTQIAVLNIVTGVFVESAMKLAQPDHTMLALERRRSDMSEASFLREVFLSLDVDMSGTLTVEEFAKVMVDPMVGSSLETVGLSASDASLLFDMLCDAGGTKEVGVQHILDACFRLRGSATNLDVQLLTYRVSLLASKMDSLGVLLAEAGADGKCASIRL